MLGGALEDDALTAAAGEGVTGKIGPRGGNEEASGPRGFTKRSREMESTTTASFCAHGLVAIAVLGVGQSPAIRADTFS